jgi:acetyl-CoA acetyltransferase
MIVVHGLTARARIVASALAGADPVVMLMAPLNARLIDGGIH